MAQEKVLIVEDEENERTGLAELVRAWGYETETASDGVEGLETVEFWDPAIVITDLRMPRMDGMQLLQRIAAQPHPVAVILLTAQGSVDADLEFLERPAVPDIGPHAVSAKLPEAIGNIVGCQIDSLGPQAAALEFVGRQIARRGRQAQFDGRILVPGSARGLRLATACFSSA